MQHFDFTQGAVRLVKHDGAVQHIRRQPRVFRQRPQVADVLLHLQQQGRARCFFFIKQVNARQGKALL